MFLSDVFRSGKSERKFPECLKFPSRGGFRTWEVGGWEQLGRFWALRSVQLGVVSGSEKWATMAHGQQNRHSRLFILGNSQKSLGAHKIRVGKIWFYTPPPEKGPKWGKPVQISRKSSKLTLFGGGGAGTQFYGQNDFMDIWAFLNPDLPFLGVLKFLGLF